MASIKIILRQEEKQDGTYPLAIRITKDRQTSYVYLNFSIMPDDWNADEQKVKKSHPNSTRLNNFLRKKLAEATDKALEVESEKTAVSVRAVRNKIRPKAGSTFFVQAAVYLTNLKASGKYNQYTSDKSRLANFKEFIGHDIAFSDITPSLLERFNSYARSTLKLGERTAVNQLVTLRSVFNNAIRDNVVDAKYYPFGKGKIKIKFPESVKIGLTPDEVKKLENAEFADPTHNHARNLWLFSFYFAGIRISDVLRMRWSDFQNDRLHYSMGKNKKGGSLKIPEKVLKILDHYRKFKEKDDDLIFPELKDCNFGDKFATQRSIAFKTSALDKCLRLHVAKEAKISKKLTMHLARHTFGNISGDKIPIQMLQKLYRHSNVTTTIGYQGNFIHKDADDALDNVLAYEPKKKYNQKKGKPKSR